MTDREIQQIFNISCATGFEAAAVETFRFQYRNNPVYNQYCNLVMDCPFEQIVRIEQIPFFPIKYFKTKRVACFDGQPQAVFTSSSTSGMQPARHYVKDLRIYEESFLKGFELFYGDIADYDILALLPSYLEREGSSLIYMAEKLIEKSKAASKGRTNKCGFYLYNHKDLYNTLLQLKEEGRKTILLGVTFALLDFCTQYSVSFPELIIMETGGMKGRGKEVTREELHRTLYKGFGTRNIHSEYGMAELMSQAYLVGSYSPTDSNSQISPAGNDTSADTLFFTPPWMKILIRNLNDPFSYNCAQNGAASSLGAINIIDLANVWSCSFIETEDVGRVVDIEQAKHSVGKEFAFLTNAFTVEGRLKDSERRGCNMLIE